MFDSPRYLTRGIQEEIPIELQMLMWGMIDHLKKEGFKLDYLQVFELKRAQEPLNQLIVHRQEVPEYKKEYRFPRSEPVTAKIFVIDAVSDIPGESYTTMLLASEY